MQSPSRNDASGRARSLAVPAVFLLALVFAGAGAGQEQPLNIAVVNLDYIVARSPAGQALQTKLGEFQQKTKGEIEAKQLAAKDIQQRIADGANSLSRDKLAELENEFEDAQIAIRRFTADKQREAEVMQQQGLKEVEEQLGPIFEKIRDEEGYDLILNNVPGVVVMVGERVEITKKVLERLGVAAGG